MISHVGQVVFAHVPVQGALVDQDIDGLPDEATQVLFISGNDGEVL